jgi:hypothetical protein
MKFDPAAFVPLAQLCKDRHLPLCYGYAKKLAFRGELPACKMGGTWYSTPEMVRSWLYRGMNKAARRLVA